MVAVSFGGEMSFIVESNIEFDSSCSIFWFCASFSFSSVLASAINLAVVSSSFAATAILSVVGSLPPILTGDSGGAAGSTTTIRALSFSSFFTSAVVDAALACCFGS